MRTRAPIWGMVPIEIFQDESMTPTMIRVYTSLSSFQGNKDSCWPKRAEIAKRANVGVDKVSTAITALIKAGWLEKIDRQSESKSSIYYVLIESELPNQQQEIDPHFESGNDPHFESGNLSPIYKTTSENNNIPATDSEAGKPTSVEDTPLTELSEEDRELYHILKESFLSQVTGGKFTNWPKEAKGLKRLLRYSTTFAVDNRSDWLQALLEAFLKLVEGHDRFWSNQPFLPSVLASDGIFPRVHKEMVVSLKDKAVADYMTKNNLW